MAIDLRFLLRRRRNGTKSPPSDQLAAEMAVHEDTSTGVNTAYYGHDIDADGVTAVESHKLFEASDGRLWNDTIGAADGSTEFVGDGSALTGTGPRDVGPGLKLVGNEIRYDIDNLTRG